MAERFSSEYPEEFEKILMNCGAKEQDFPKVYRIAYEGVLNAQAFESTYANKVRRGMKLSPEAKQDVGTYSTSCFEQLEDAKYIREVVMRRQRKAKIAQGKIRQETCYSQLTKERDPQKMDSHIDWWIFGTTQVEEEIIPYFSLCEEG